jgi:hypothetical protein
MFSKLKKEAGDRAKKKPEKPMNLDKPEVAEPIVESIEETETEIAVLESVIAAQPVQEKIIEAPPIIEELVIDLSDKKFKFQAHGTYYNHYTKEYRLVTVEYDPINSTSAVVADEFIAHSPQMAMAILNKKLLFNVSKRKFEV